LSISNLEQGLVLIAGSETSSPEKLAENYSEEALRQFKPKRLNHAAEVLAALAHKRERMEKN
jgi:hypothetical protein